VSLSNGAQMDQVLGELRRARSEAAAQVSSSWDLFTGGSAKAANLYFLNEQAPKLITSLDTTARAKVMAGTWTLAQWLADAKTLWGQIQSTGADVGSWSFSGVVGSTFTATALDVKDGAVAVAKGTTPLAALVVVALVLLVVLRFS
jgi:hypothetical protein